MLETILRGVNRHRQEGRKAACQKADDDTTKKGLGVKKQSVVWNWKKRAHSQKVATHDVRYGAGQHHGYQASRFPLEKQQLDSQQHGGHGSSERGGHPSCRARHKERLPLGAGQMK